MFEEELMDRLRRIFDFKKATYDDPGLSLEQQCLFIQIDRDHCKITDALETHRVEGRGLIYSQASELPFGYFLKRIQASPLADTADLFFYDLDESQKVAENIVQRSFSFVFLFSKQYDPRIGELTSVTLQRGDS